MTAKFALIDKSNLLLAKKQTDLGYTCEEAHKASLDEVLSARNCIVNKVSAGFPPPGPRTTIRTLTKAKFLPFVSNDPINKINFFMKIWFLKNRMSFFLYD